MTDDVLEGNEEPLTQEPKLTPEQEDEQAWSRLSTWNPDPNFKAYKWAFVELENIFGEGRVAIGDVDFGHRIACACKLRFSNGVVVRSAIDLRVPAYLEGEKGFDVNTLPRNKALSWIRTESIRLRARAAKAAWAEWKNRHPEEDKNG